MHNYLGAIGFSKLNKVTDIDALIRGIIDAPDDKIVVEDETGRVICEMTYCYGPDIGIKVCGEYDENDRFHVEHYFPFFRGANISAQAEITFERNNAKEAYSAAYEDPRVGVTMIFFLQNMGEYLNLASWEREARTPLSVQMTGLAKEGSVLFPIRKDEELEEKNRENTRYRNRLLTEARSGNEEAMESLTMEDIDTYSMISKRIAREDVLSIVDTYFMPYGLECDQYHIMGDIQNCELVENRATGEEVYQMELLCNDIHLDICINRDALFGEPAVGRRFKGIIWLQGCVNF